MKNSLGNYNKKYDYIIFVFSLATFFYLLVSLSRIISTSAPDFPSYYYATSDLLEQRNPYIDKNIPNIFLYPAVTSIIYLPLLSLSYTYAQALFIILSALAVPFIVAITIQTIYRNFSWRLFLFFTSLVYLFFPTKFTLGMGQVNLLAYLLLLYGYYFYRTKKMLPSSILFAIAILAKPILFFLILFFVAEKAWRSILLISIALLFMLLFSFVLYGTESEYYYITALVPSLIGGVEGREVYYNQGVMGFISRLFDDSLIRRYATLVINFILIGVAFILIKRNKVDTNTTFSLFLTLLVITHTLSWQHYFVFLIFPFIFVSKIILQKKKGKVLCCLIVSYLLISINIKNTTTLLHFPSNLLLSHTLYGAIILLVTQYILIWKKK